MGVLTFIYVKDFLFLKEERTMAYVVEFMKPM